MTSYIEIPNTSIDSKSPVTDILFSALRDNPIAISEGSTDAPYAQAMWHPYNGVTWGDGNTGEIWSFTADGLTNTFQSPNFEDGYEYRFIFEDLSHDGSLAQDLDIDAYLIGETDNWESVTSISVGEPNSAAINQYTFLDFMLPRLSRETHRCLVNFGVSIVSFSGGGQNDDKIRNLRFTMPGGVDLDQGAIYMHRRRSYF